MMRECVTRGYARPLKPCLLPTLSPFAPQGPEGGWGYDTAVVSIGQARLFTFRRISDPSIRATFAVRHGDVLHMFDNCQARSQPF